MKRLFALFFLVLSSSFFMGRSVVAAPAYDYELVAQSPYVTLAPGETQTLWIELKNTGTVPWTTQTVRLGASLPLDRVSVFRTSAWLSGNRAASFESPRSTLGVVPPGYSARFHIPIQAPLVGGTYREHFRPVADGYTWMKDIGIYWDITVTQGAAGGQPIPDPASIQDNREVLGSDNDTYAHVRLAVPQLYQLPLSCEATALDMALAYHKKSPGLATLIGQIGTDPAPVQKSGDNIISWGDPHQAFVGNIHGQQYIDGYGVYWDPIARVGSLYGESVAFSGWSLSQILEQVQQGDPVLIWGSVAGRIDPWTTPAGREIYAVHGQHVWVVTGFEGTLSDPVRIYINDPQYGPMVLSKADFAAFAAWFNNSGVVVY